MPDNGCIVADADGLILQIDSYEIRLTTDDLVDKLFFVLDTSTRMSITELIGNRILQPGLVAIDHGLFQFFDCIGHSFFVFALCTDSYCKGEEQKSCKKTSLYHD